MITRKKSTFSNFLEISSIFENELVVEIIPLKALAYEKLIFDEDAKLYASGNIDTDEIDIYIMFEGMQNLKLLHTVSIKQFYKFYKFKK